MEVANADADVVGYESIMKDGAAVGYVTSGAFGHCLGKSLAAGYVPAVMARDGAHLEIEGREQLRGELAAIVVLAPPLLHGPGARPVPRVPLP